MRFAAGQLSLRIRGVNQDQSGASSIPAAPGNFWRGRGDSPPNSALEVESSADRFFSAPLWGNPPMFFFPGRRTRPPPPRRNHGPRTQLRLECLEDRMCPSAATLDFSTFLGGSGSDRALAVAVDSAGNSYVTRHTSS